jgi:hypothetical protein
MKRKILVNPSLKIHGGAIHRIVKPLQSVVRTKRACRKFKGGAFNPSIVSVPARPVTVLYDKSDIID